MRKQSTLFAAIPAAAILAIATAAPAQVIVEDFNGYSWNSWFGMERPGSPDVGERAPTTGVRSTQGDRSMLVTFDGLSGMDGFAGIFTEPLTNSPEFAEASFEVYMESSNADPSQHLAVKLEVQGQPGGVGNGSDFIKPVLDEWTTITWDVGETITVDRLAITINFQPDGGTTTGDFSLYFDNFRLGPVGNTEIVDSFEGTGASRWGASFPLDINNDFPAVSRLGYLTETENGFSVATDGDIHLTAPGPAPLSGERYLSLQWSGDPDGNVGFFHRLNDAADVSGFDAVEVDVYVPAGQPLPSNLVMAVVDDDFESGVRLGNVSQVAASEAPDTNGIWQTASFPLSGLTALGGDAADATAIRWVEFGAIGAGADGELYFDNVRLAQDTRTSDWELFY